MPIARKLPSGSWHCKVYSHTEEVTLPDGTKKSKRVYKPFTCKIPGAQGKRICEKMAAEWAENKEDCKPDPLKITFGDALNMYIDNRSAVLSPGTVRLYRYSRDHYFSDLENLYVEEITQEQVQAAINKAALSHAPKTVRNIHGLVSAVMRTFRPDFVLRTELPKKQRANLHIPTDQEVAILINHLRQEQNEMEIPVLLAAFGPMRRGEICALRYEDITGNVVHVHRALAYNENKEWVEKAPKTYTSDRYIQFPDFVIERIGSGTGRIISYTPDALSSRFEHILKHAGLPHFRFHDLRHYSASIQHALGVPDVYIMQRGGWSTPSVLDGIYRHALDDRQIEMNQIANDHFINLCKTE